MVEIGRQHSKGHPPLAVQTRRAKGVGDGGRRVLHQQGALQRQHHHLDDRTAAALEIAAIADLGLQAISKRIEGPDGVRADGIR